MVSSATPARFAKLRLAVAIGRAVADEQAFDGRVGETAHAVGLLLEPAAVAYVERKAATGEEQDDEACDRNRRGDPAGWDGCFGNENLGRE